MSNELTHSVATSTAIASSSENVGVIVERTPEFYNSNRKSHDNCLSSCTALLETIEKSGMTDELDQKAALYIEKTRRTIKDMTERRSPVTQLFDRVRKEFTALENDINPATAGTVTYRLQQHRNRYAAMKREQEEARRKAEEAKRQAEAAREQYRAACVDDYKGKFNELVVSRINELTELSGSLTLENYQAVLDTLTGFSDELPSDWQPTPSVRIPFNITPDEARLIRGKAFQELSNQFREQYHAEVGDYRQDILDRMPSKKAELERMAKASEEEAARIREAVRRKEAEEAARKERERAERERQEAKKAEVRKANDEAAGLFDAVQATVQSYQPKAKVTKRIRVVRPEGYLKVFMMWWAKSGSTLSDEELAKVFKKQVTYCENLANKEGEFVRDADVEYVDEVKAQ